MAEVNKKQLKHMEDEFMKLQKIELSLTGDNTESKKIIEKYATAAYFYSNAKKIDKLIEELESLLSDIAKTGRVRGKVMSLKTMGEYLDNSERIMHKTRVIDAIDRVNTKRAQKRMAIYVMELAKSKNILKSDIDIFLEKGKLAGLPEKEVLKRLVLAAESNAGPVNQFAKRLETIEREVLRREASATEIDEYAKAALPDEKWQWITISVSPCPDCEIRAGVVLPFDEWQGQGLPGDGATICRASCMCKLIPYSIAEDLFPEVKTFTWNKESGVLTTPKEIKKFASDKNRGGNT